MNDLNHDLLAAMLEDEEAAEADQAIAATTREGDEVPLSHSQQQLWFLQSMAPGLTAYNLPRAFRLEGELDADALKRAFDAVIARHGVLRTRFFERDGVPMQAMLPPMPFDLARLDLSGCETDERQIRLDEAIDRTVNHVFDLGAAPPLVACLIKLGPQEHVLAACLHHIASDAWSNPVFAGDLVTAYRQALASTDAVALPPLALQYADYAAWQRHGLAEGRLQAQLAHWQAHLGPLVPALEMPIDHVRPDRQTFAGAGCHFDLPAASFDQLKAFCRQEKCTPFVALLAAWQILLSRYSGQGDFAVGVPNAGRHREELQDLLGFFVVTQVYRARLSATTTMRQVCRQVRADSLSALAHADLPFEVLRQHRQEARDPARSPIFQVMFGLQMADDAQLLALEGLTARAIDFTESGAKFELSLDVAIGSSGVRGRLEYNTDLFETGTARRLVEHFLRVVDQMAAQPDTLLGDVVLPGEAESLQLRQWGCNEHRHAGDVPVHRLIEAQAAQDPQALAVILDGEVLTRGDLNQRANRLARRLVQQGVGPESRVGIAVERSPAMIVGLLAILKAGACYVPLDPGYPRDRLAAMIEDSGVTCLLTQSHLTPLLDATGRLASIELDCIDLSEGAGQDLNLPVHPHNLAYMIYTSGSTGVPKGIGIAHHALSEHTQVSIGMFGLTAQDRMLQFSTLNFDGCIEQIYPALCAGAAIVLRGPELWDSETFHRQVLRHGITVADLTTAYWFLLVQDHARQATGDHGPLRQVHAGGEAMPPEGIKAWREAGMSHIRLLNTYGPTEATVTATVLDCGALVAGQQVLPGQMSIGAPLPGRRLHVVDADLNPVPPGVPGELCIGGPLLARGYNRRASLTAERFVADPFDPHGGRLYRTGDLVRWQPDGQLQYLGRIDHQVKVRGFRIELGEVEAHLLDQPGVRQAVVVARAAHGGQRLVAYASGDDGVTLLPATLRQSLSRTLPDYMLPSAIVVLPALPLNPNGKVDRAALPEVDDLPVPTDGAQDEPQGDIETALATVWAGVLGRPHVGRHENFFELGGDSILSLQIISRFRQAGWKVTPRQVFERQTVALLADVATAVAASMDKPPRQGTVGATQADWPLLPIQSQFFDLALPQPHHWNQAVLLRSTQPLDEAHLASALNELVRHHEALRLRFFKDASGQWRQRVAAFTATGGQASRPLLWSGRAANAQEIEALCAHAQRSLDIEQGPLLRALLIDAGEEGTRLLLAIHHLAVDGVSWRILLEDLQSFYACLNAGQAVALVPTTDRYVDWAQSLQDDAQALAEQMPHWLSLAGTPVALPLDDRKGEHLAGAQRSVRMALDAEATRALLQAAPSAYRTQVNDLLLAALGAALCQWSGQPRLLIDVEGHGRESRHEETDLSRTVGWFTSLYPVMLEGGGEPGDSIKRMKERLRQVPGRGLGHGVLRHAGTPVQRAQLAALPRPQVVFNYLGQFDGAQQQGDAVWSLADESAGPTMDEHTRPEHELSILGQVHGGQLTVDFRHSPARLSTQRVQALADAFGQALRDLVDHCAHGPQGVTPSDFPLAALDQAELDALPVPVADVADLYPLSPMQQGMLFHSLLEQGAYETQMRVDIHGLDAARFARAWQSMIDRHPVLRTGFLHQSAKPRQWVARHVELACAMHDWCDRQASLPADLDALACSDLAQGFDLQHPPLMRLSLVRTAPECHHFIWTCHHLLLDGWSVSQLLGDVLRQYDGQPWQPSPPYRDYIAWLQSRDQFTSEQHWRRQLQKLDQPCILGMALPTSSESTDWHIHHGGLDATSTQALARFAKTRRVTVNTLVQAAWALLLRRCTGQPTVCFGATVSGRPDELPGADRMLGLFINTQPVINTPEASLRLGDWLAQLQADGLAAREHEHTPLHDIQRWVGRAGQALFDTLVVFENYPVDEALAEATSGGLRFERAINEERTNYALTLAVSLSDELRIKFGHALSSFSAASVARLSAHLEQLLKAFAANADQRLGEIFALTAPEKLQLQSWGSPLPAWATSEAVHQAIERQARLRPHAPALLLGEQTMDFDTLNRCANRLAHRLLASGLERETRIGVVVERSLDTFVGLLAVLKAGATYVPLDPEYPAERIAYMLQDSAVAWLLTHSHLHGRLPAVPCPQLDLDRVDQAEAEPARDVTWELDPVRAIHPEQLAYVIYTSGSTGRPKGVSVAHAPLSMHCDATAALYEMSPSSREFHFLSLAFDGAHERWLTALRCGASLVLRGPGLWSAEQTHEALARHGATHAGFPPSYLQQVADWAQQAGLKPDLHLVSFGGEAMSRAGFEHARASLQPRRMINGYGPTEAVVTPLAWKTSGDGAFESAYAPIGQPCGDRTAHILDADGQPVPPGVAGELYLGGAGLARGYLGRPGLTAERFVADPFSDTGGRLYRTGDWVRWNEQGQVEYLGRIDQQVKVRGFRIEIGEVEAHLRELDGVQEAVALARERDGVKRLLGYVTHQADARALDAQALRRQLAARVPDHMVPAVITVLPHWPLTPNGKVDRQALPDPVWAPGIAQEPPQGPIEHALAEVWAAVLGLDAVGRHDNFFEIGGDSIISLQIVARARRAGWQVGPKQIFECRTVARLAEVAEAVDAAQPQAELAPPEGDVPLLPIQQRFLSLGLARPGHFNQSVLLRSDQPIDAVALQQALAAVMRHHDALRMRFEQGEGGTWRQAYAPWQSNPELLWQRRASSTAELGSLCDEAQRSLDLAPGSLLRALLIEVANDGWRLLLAVHHLVIDGMSWRIVLEDLRAAYEQALAGQAPMLPRRTSSLQHWSRRLRGLADDASMLAAARAHWQTDTQTATRWSSDEAGAASATLRQARTLQLRFTQPDTHRLLREAPAAYRTQVNDLLLTALARALHRTAREPGQGVWVDLEGHGREDLFDEVDLSRTVGWFTSVYPVYLTAGDDLGHDIGQVKQRLMDLPHKGLPFGVLNEFGDDAIRQQMACLPRREVLFNYLGQFDGRATGELGWRLADEPAGASSDADMPLSHDLIFNGEVIDGVLTMSLTFGAKCHAQEAVQALLDAYEAELLAVIDHCVSAQGGVSVSDFPLARLQPQSLRELLAKVHAPAREIEDIFPLTAGQQAMMAESLLVPGTDVNIVQMQARLTELDLPRLQQAWQQAVARHGMLRTGFHQRSDGQAPLQVMLSRIASDIEVHDWRGHATPEALEAAWETLCASERARPFDLAKPPLARWLAVRIDDNTHRLAWTWHHLLLDGWSMSRLLGEVFTAYAGGHLPQAGPAFSTLVRAIEAAEGQADHDGNAAAFWQTRQVRSGPPALLIRAPLQAWAAEGLGAHAKTLDTQALQPLRAFANIQQVTLNTLVQAAWALVLMARTGRECATFGVTMSGRSLALDGIDEVMGLCINTLPLMVHAAPGQMVGDWLRTLQLDNLEMRQHEHVSLTKIQSWLGLEDQTLYDTLVLFENYPIDAAVRGGPADSLQMSEVKSHGALAMPLTLVIVPSAAGLVFSLEYAKALFSLDQVDDLLSQFMLTLSALAHQADAPVRTVTVPAHRFALSSHTFTQDHHAHA